jgi:hypothetical protein
LVSGMNFYRQAYGFVNYETDVSFYAVKNMVENVFKHTKVKSVVLKESKGDAVEGRIAKLLYNLAIMAANTIMQSGDLKILLGVDSITATCTAQTYRLDEDLEETLRGQTHAANLSYRNGHVAFFAMIARDIGYEITVEVVNE